jgi:hypothetical protein
MSLDRFTRPSLKDKIREKDQAVDEVKPKKKKINKKKK